MALFVMAGLSVSQVISAAPGQWHEGQIVRNTSTGEIELVSPSPIVVSQSDVPQVAPTATSKSNKNGKLVFYDGFEYKVNKSKDSDRTFKKHGWSKVKAVNISGRHAGYLYTVDKIPGYKGPFPGKNSGRVLAIQNASATFGSQSDFYLQYGNPRDPNTEQVPGNVWFQFWLYPNHYDDPANQNDQLSYFDDGFKFIYPTSCGYPSKCEKWIWSPGNLSAEPHWDNLGRGAKDLYFRLGGSNTTKRYAYAEKYNAWKLGPQNLDERIVHNRWTLVKIHIDTSGDKGKFELWLKPLGGKFTKVAEWIDGVTPGFSWPLSKSQQGGHQAFRMPTTVNPNYDWWIYMDDFAMATSEAALPQY